MLLWKHVPGGLAAQTVLIICVTLLILQWSLRRPLASLTKWLRDVRQGSASGIPELPEVAGLQPLQREVSRLATSLNAARAAAEQEARLRNAGESLWTAERLRISVQAKLDGARLFAISNREPYEHIRKGRSVECSVPASGLVTALEPVLRACDGTWIAQGTGDADRETVDEHNRIRVPPDHPQYTLRRVWLTPEEELGFYLGFANEGLWPLCHIAHTRPTFRAEDWEHYREVNQRFAEAFIEEAEGEKDPLVLVQDYHFALVPKMIKEARPDARVAIFWHIPWPNAEAFGICPWQRELLEGLLGADLIGFHIQSHCNNFLEDGGPGGGGAHRSRTRGGESRRSFYVRASVPHQRRLSGRTGGDRVFLCGARGVIREIGREGGDARRRRGPRGLHEGHPGAVPRDREISSRNIRRTGGNSRLCRSARPAARISEK